LDQVVAKMLAREPSARYKTPGEVAEALATFSSETSDTPQRSVVKHLPEQVQKVEHLLHQTWHY